MGAREVFIVGSARTPIGSFQGALSAVSAPQLGATAIREALKRANVAPELVDETYMGNVLTAGVGQAPARQAAKAAGVGDKTPATTVGKVCGSGLMSVILGTKSLKLEDAEIVVAGGMESMTNAPYLLPQGRGGFRMGDSKVVDSMVFDGLWDPYNNFHMGVAGELCAKELGFSREAQDEFAVESYKRAHAAQKDGKFSAELTPVTYSNPQGRGHGFRGRRARSRQLRQDAEAEAGVRPKKKARLRPRTLRRSTTEALRWFWRAVKPWTSTG